VAHPTNDPPADTERKAAAATRKAGARGMGRHIIRPFTVVIKVL